MSAAPEAADDHSDGTGREAFEAMCKAMKKGDYSTAYEAFICAVECSADDSDAPGLSIVVGGK